MKMHHQQFILSVFYFILFFYPRGTEPKNGPKIDNGNWGSFCFQLLFFVFFYQYERVHTQIMTGLVEGISSHLNCTICKRKNSMNQGGVEKGVGWEEGEDTKGPVGTGPV